ncbi:MAG: T9SS type A sorting domain-containing protein [Saprospiraceae bacterium]|nr:T9SS type A sorting domain-containing protein [Saprospiraceae bacterium]
MFKTSPFLFLFIFIGFSMLAQTDIELNIQHKFEKSNFIQGQTYLTDDNRAILISRIEYFISNIELIHDGTQTSTVTNYPHLLINGQTTTYNLGTVNSSVQELEYINFDVGVDASANQNTPNTYPTGHALSTTNMYSNNQFSYIFIAIEGMMDSNGDQIPDKPFVLHATGDHLLRNISTAAKTASTNNTLKINLIANVAKFLNDIDLELAGIQENGGVINQKLCDNTEDYTVFSNVGTTNVNTLVSPQNQINIDSRLSYKPTIHYKFYTSEELDMTITNLNGSYFIQRHNLAPDGNYFIDDDLASGIYIVIFSTPKGIRQCKRFIIRN